MVHVDQPPRPRGARSQLSQSERVRSPRTRDHQATGQRTDAIEELGARANELLAETGVEIVDVRINRMDLPQQALSAAYEQMREQQHAIARETRVRGERLAREVRAAAEKQARATRAEANAFSERERGNGDAGAARIYADAFNADPEFYAFVRSLEAYRATLGDKTTLVLSPDHAFFRFLDPASSR